MSREDDELAGILARAQAAHSDRVVVGVDMVKSVHAERQAAQNRRKAQSDAARHTNKARTEKTRVAVERALHAVLGANDRIPRRNLASAVDRWLQRNWSRSFSMTTIGARLDELLPRLAQAGKENSRDASEL